MYEVAQRAGVSASTVSRVLSGHVGVSQEKAERVRKAVEELGFRINRTARSLRRQHSAIIALIVPDIENPFFTALARGVEDVSQAAGYSVVLCNSDENPAKEARYIDVALSENMSGVILAAAEDHSDLHSLVGFGRSVVIVDRGRYGYPADAVMAADVDASRAVTQALAAKGFSRIACITGPVGVDNATLRAEGWRQGTGVTPDQEPALLRHENYRLDGGYNAMVELLDSPNPPDAVFTANNLMAVGALHALRERGLTPAQFGFATFGTLPYASLAPPGICIVDVSARDLGSRAAKILLTRIRGDDRPFRTEVLPFEVRWT